MPASSSAGSCCTHYRTASTASATTASSPMAPAATASLSAIGCSMHVTPVPASLPTIVPKAMCRQLAIDQDDLTLLRGMTEKERSKIKRKGISTITQLSYSYRPRRRRRKRSVDEILTSGPGRPATVARNDQALRALAIKKQQAHIQGAPSLRIEGTPVVLDVEGMPDRDFYYLIGLRFIDGNKQVQKSFWANGPDG